MPKLWRRFQELVSSFDGSEIINPISWFWPAEYRLVYAFPDVSTSEPRFFIMSFGRDEEEEQPAIWLIAVNCVAGTETHYWPARNGESGEPARNALGEPLTAPDGRMYRRHDTDVPPQPARMRAFCETDWSRERQAIRDS